MEEKFYEFIKEAHKRVQKEVQNDCEVILEKIIKNNECESFCMIFKMKEISNRICALPVINMTAWYFRFLLGESVEDIVEKIVCSLYNSLSEDNGINETLFDKSNVADNIFFRLINYEKNKNELQKVPYVIYNDLAITFHILCKTDLDAVQSFRINNELLGIWKYTTDELYNMARLNTPRLFPEKMSTIDDIIRDSLRDLDSGMYGEMPDTEFLKVFILSNDRHINGSSAILYSKYIGELAQLYDTDIIILPSSVHEVILTPYMSDFDCDYLKSMVAGINKDHVANEDILSDNVYIYSKDSGNIFIYN